jgi:hypothetical protein
MGVGEWHSLCMDLPSVKWFTNPSTINLAEVVEGLMQLLLTEADAALLL